MNNRMNNKANNKIGTIVDHNEDSDVDSRVNGHVNIRANHPQGRKSAKKKLWITAAVVLSVLVTFFVYLFSTGDNGVGAQSQPDTSVSRKMIEELRKEQKVVEDERLRLQQYEQNLKNLESELDRRFSEVVQKEKDLTLKDELFNKKVADRTVDRQTLETYENIDPEQAAELLKSLYIKDPPLATLLMRKMAGKKAGKILEAMIPLDKEIATQLAKQTLDYYKPDSQ